MDVSLNGALRIQCIMNILNVKQKNRLSLTLHLFLVKWYDIFLSILRCKGKRISGLTFCVEYASREFVLMQFVLVLTPNVVKGISGFAEVKEHVVKTTHS
jgi:hypothetical protein